MSAQASFALRGRNPDVLTCIANLSNDEVFTPPEFANRMLDAMAEAWAADNNGADIWADKKVTFLDPFTKSGVFLREITGRLTKGLEKEFPDLQERVDHILTKQVFGIGITCLTSLLARRSVYCSKFANGKHSVAKSFTTEQGRKYSPAAQREAIEQAASREGVSIAEWFMDHETGTTENRRDFQRLKKRVFEGGIGAVHVLCVDRFARDVEDALRISRQFLEHGAKLKFIETPADLETPEGKFQFTQYAAFAAFEHARLCARTLKGRNKKMDGGKGRPDSWNLPYALGIEGDAPRILEKEAEALHRMFQWRREGRSIRAIAGLCHQHGIRPRKAAFWSPRTIQGMLQNRCYIGEYWRCGHVWPVPPIISRELFDDVQRQMQAVRERLVGRPSENYLLRGMLFCRCSRRMHGTQCHTGSGGRWRHYICSGKHHRNPRLPAPCSAPRIGARAVEELVWREIWKLLSDPVRFRSLAEALAAEERAKAPARRDPAAELESLKRRQEKILEMVEAGLYAIATAEPKIMTLRKKIAALEIEARTLHRVIEIAPADAIERACRALASGPEPEGYEARRLVLEGLLELRASVNGGDLTIGGKLPVPAAEVKKNCEDRLGAVGGEPGLGHLRDLLSGNQRGLVRREGSNGEAAGKGSEEAKWLKGRKMPGWGEEKSAGCAG